MHKPSTSQLERIQLQISDWMPLLILAAGVLMSILLIFSTIRHNERVLGASTASPQCQADLNLDSTVDLTDYSTLVNDLLKPTPSNSRSDIDGDGSVSLTDYSLLVSVLGQECIPNDSPPTLKISLEASRANSVSLEGFSAASGVPLYIWLDGNVTGPVVFKINNIYEHIENLAPWDAYGGTASTANSWDPAVGSYTVVAEFNGKVLTASVTITAGTVAPPPTIAPPPPPPISTKNIYVSPDGSAGASGSASSPVNTIQAAINLAKGSGAGDTTIWLNPGVYRQSATIVDAVGTTAKPLQVAGVNGGAGVYVVGSETSQDSRISWVKSSGNQPFPAGVANQIYYADISVWGAAPELAFQTNSNYTTINRLQKAREPDIDPFFDAEFGDDRWQADGRSSNTNNTLIDATNDPAPIQSGNLKNINGFTSSFLTGARTFIHDGYSGHDQYTALITAHDAATGRITLDRDVKFFNGAPLVDKYSKYYVEGKPQLLDQPGEWYYDAATKRLYIWPPNNISPAQQQIEFAVRPSAFSIKNSQNVMVRDLKVRFTNYLYGRTFGEDAAVNMENSASQATKNVVIQNLDIMHSGFGIRLNQNTGSGKLMEQITLRNNRIGYIDGLGLMVFNYPYGNASSYVAGIKNILIENNEIHHGGFRPTGNGTMIWIFQATNMIIQNNYIHHSNHNGLEIHGGINTNALVRNNYFRENCINASDCGGFKIWSASTSMRNVLVMNNIVEGTKGCSFASKATGKGLNSAGVGCWGFGFYSDFVKSSASPEHAAIFYRNLSHNNGDVGYQITKGDDHALYSNILINERSGFHTTSNIGGSGSNNNTAIKDNIFINHNTNPPRDYTLYGTPSKLYDQGLNMAVEASDRSKFSIDRNIYQMTGQGSIDMYMRDVSKVSTQKFMSTVTDIRNQTIWEDNGRDANGPVVNIPTGTSGLDIRSIEAGVGVVNVSPDQKVKDMAQRIGQALGITIDLNSTWVGLK